MHFVKNILFLFCLLSSMELFAQDKIFLKSGDTLHVIISQQDDKSVNYTEYDDPEFNMQFLPTDQITRIQFNNGKIIDFKKSKYPGYYVGIYLGEAVPVSDFAHAEVNDARSGFAKSKAFLSFEARMRVFRVIGAEADVSIGTFGVDSGPYFQYENQFPTGSSIQSVSGKLSDYKYGTFSIGPDLGFNMGRKFKVFLPIQFSVISIGTQGEDAIHYTYVSDTTTTTIYRSSAGTGAGVALGLKLDYLLGKHIGLGVSIKAQDYAVVMKVQERYEDGTTINYKWNQRVTFFNAGLNLHYYFK